MVLENQYFIVLLQINLLVLNLFLSQRQYNILKINKSILTKITFYLEDDDRRMDDINGEVLSIKEGGGVKCNF